MISQLRLVFLQKWIELLVRRKIGTKIAILKSERSKKRLEVFQYGKTFKN